MALRLTNVPNPYDRANPFETAYAWIAGVYLDISQNSGTAVFNVNPNEDSAKSPPLFQVTIRLGEVLVPADPTADPPVEEIRFPTLEQLMGNAGSSFSTAFNLIGADLYENALNHPMFKDAFPV